MRRIFCTIATACLLISLLVSNAAAYTAEAETPIWQEVAFTQEEIKEILSNNPTNNMAARATGLIGGYSIAISKSGNTMYIVGETSCISDVVKCGFTEVVIQRKLITNTKWIDYITYEDIYADGAFYLLSRSVTVPAGYEYRVICTHYAKKHILSTQKIDNVSNVILF